MRVPICLALAWLGLFVASTAAHFNMLLPQSSTAKKGESLTLLYQWGHPFEHQLFDAPRPVSLLVLAPDGNQTELTASLKKTTRKAGSKPVTAYQLRFTPEQRGDHVFVLETPPIWLEEDGEFLQDTVKCVLHVQTQKGWDAVRRQEFEFVPLTRPYGLRPGMVFQAQIRGTGKEQAAPGGTLIEVEHYHAAPPRKLPPDEHITRTVRTDPNGVATTTLTEPGWWCLTASRLHGTQLREGKRYPVRQRCTLWVFVDEAAGSE